MIDKEKIYIRCTMTCPKCGGKMIADNYIKGNLEKNSSINLIDFNMEEYEGTIYTCLLCKNKIEVQFVNFTIANEGKGE